MVILITAQRMFRRAPRAAYGGWLWIVPYSIGMVRDGRYGIVAKSDSYETVRHTPQIGAASYIRSFVPDEPDEPDARPAASARLQLTGPTDGPFHVMRITWNGQTDHEGRMRDVLDHWHPALEIVYTVIGHATHYVDGKAYTASPGSVLVINSRSVHRIESDVDSYRSYPKDTVVAIVVHIDIDYMRSMIQNFDSVYFRTALEQDDDDEGRLMRDLGLCAGPDAPDPDPYRYLHEISLISELLYRICVRRFGRRADSVPVRRAKNIERLREILDYVGEHYMERVSEQSVAQRFFFTKEYFARFFKANTGMTFMQYVTRRRLLDAVQLLQDTDMTMTAIAEACGFSDTRGLINAFGKYYGTTPLQYRKSLGDRDGC